MASQSFSPDGVQYRYRPCAVLNTDVPPDQQTQSNSANELTPKYSEYSGRFGNIVQPHGSHLFMRPFENANSDIRVVSASPITRPAHCLGETTWNSLSPYCSPSPSGSSYSSCDSRAWSEIHGGSWASADPSMCCSPQPQPQPSIGRTSIDSMNMLPPPEMAPASSCISLSEVQHFAAPDNETYSFEGGKEYLEAQYNIQAPSYLASQIMVDSTLPCASGHYVYDNNPYYGQGVEREIKQEFSVQNGSTCSLSTGTSVEKKRRQKHRHSIPAPGFSPTRVSKRNDSMIPRRLGVPQGEENQGNNITRASRSSLSNTSFPCSLALYGCTSSFGSKNEWKRHVNTQHLRLDLWRCDLCDDRENRPNDFNRKDLFMQHLRRMHVKTLINDPERARRSSLHGPKGGHKGRYLGNDREEAEPELHVVEQRCHIRLRQPPHKSFCLFCPATFRGSGSWEERMEHVGRHLEQNKKDGKDAPPVQSWRVDETVEQWLVSEGLIIHDGHSWSVTDGRRN